MLGYYYGRTPLNELDTIALINSDSFRKQEIKFIKNENFETSIGDKKLFTHVITESNFKGTIYECKVIKIKGKEHYIDLVHRIRYELPLEVFFKLLGIKQKPTSIIQ